MLIKIVAKKRILDASEGGEKFFEIVSLEAPTVDQVPTFYRTGYPCVFLNLRGHLLIWSVDEFYELAPGDLINEAMMIRVNKIINHASQQIKKAKKSLSWLQQKWDGKVTFIDGREEVK